MFKKFGGLMMVGALAVSATAQARPVMPRFDKLPRAKQLSSQTLMQGTQLVDALDASVPMANPGYPGTPYMPNDPALGNKLQAVVRLQASAQDLFVQLGAYVRGSMVAMPGAPAVTPMVVENAVAQLEYDASVAYQMIYSGMQPSQGVSQLVAQINASIAEMHDIFSPFNAAREALAPLSQSARLAAQMSDREASRPIQDPRQRNRMRAAAQQLSLVSQAVANVEASLATREPVVANVQGAQYQLEQTIARARGIVGLAGFSPETSREFDRTQQLASQLSAIVNSIQQ